MLWTVPGLLAEELVKTPSQTEGPFYPDQLPLDTDNDLLTINDARLTFFESKGTLDKVLGATANGFDANYRFSGEGQTWQRVERLTRTDAKLHRRTDAAAGQEPPVDLTYMRCGER